MWRQDDNFVVSTERGPHVVPGVLPALHVDAVGEGHRNVGHGNRWQGGRRVEASSY